jgi:hypothetical protein
MDIAPIELIAVARRGPKRLGLDRDRADGGPGRPLLAGPAVARLVEPQHMRYPSVSHGSRVYQFARKLAGL